MRREAEEWWREAAVDGGGARPGSGTLKISAVRYVRVTPYDLQPSATNNRTGVP